jgi:outer membrane murein-binding lipoprotein Lpp
VKQKRVLLAAVLAALLLAAPAEGATPAQRIAKLERQVARLSVQVRTLRTRVRRLDEALECTSWVPFMLVGHDDGLAYFVYDEIDNPYTTWLLQYRCFPAPDEP